MNTFLNRYKNIIFGTLGSLLALVAFTFTTLPDGNFHLYFLDVGQGDSSLIKTPANYIIMVDGGPNNKVLTGLNKTLPFWNKKIDLLIATHPDLDHIGGLKEVLKRYQVARIWFPEVIQDTAIYQELLAEVSRQSTIVVHPREGDNLEFADGAAIQVLWPRSRKPTFTSLNQDSVVVLVKFGSFSTLLTGDATEETQPYPDIDQKVTVLKVPHHGAKNSLNPTFLEQIKPAVAVFSVGEKNKYGHPVAAVVDQVKNIGAQVLATKDRGTIEVVSDGKNWYTRTER